MIKRLTMRCLTKHIFALVLLLTFTTTSFAQQLPIDNQYMLNTFALNPAFAGSNGNIEAFLGYRSSWLGVEGAPKLSQVNLNAAFGETMGLGMAIKSESAGNFEHFHAAMTYAYHLKISDLLYASLGMEATLYKNQLDNSRIDSKGLDPVLENAVALGGTAYDAGAGIGIWANGLTFGVAAKRLIGSKVNYEGDENSFFYQPDMHINGFLSYMIEVGNKRGRRRRRGKAPKLRIEPIAVVHYTAKQVFYDAAVNILFKDRVWMGAVYRTDGSVGMHLGGALQERIIMNYTYEFGMGETIAAQSSGTHELTIGFLLKAPERRKKKHGRTLFLLDPPKTRGGSTPIGPDLKADNATTPAELPKAFMDSLNAYKLIADARITKLEEDVAYLTKKAEEKIEDEEAANYEAPFVINNIKFGNNSARLFASSHPELNKLVKKLKDNPKWEIKIIGYTDNVGSKNYNARLSKKRAESVQLYLTTKGITKSRIIADGKGQENPRAANTSKQGRQQNRRIEGAFKKNKK